MDEERKFLEYKSLSEAVLDLRTVQVPNTWEGNVSLGDSPAETATDASQNMFRKQNYTSKFEKQQTYKLNGSNWK